MMRNKITGWALFVFAALYGIYIGGGLFETVVIVPVWSVSAEAMRAWGSNPLSAIDGARFFMVMSPLTALLAVLTGVFGWNAPAPLRFWLRLSVVLYLLQFAVTIGWFVPEQMAIKGPTMIKSLSDAEIMARAWRWIMLNYVRAVFVAVEVFAVMKAVWLAGISLKSQV